MTSGIRRPECPRPARRSLLAALSLGAAAAAAGLSGPGRASAQTRAASTGWDLDALMAGMSERKRTRARFVERQFIGLLDEPVDATGELLFEAPGKLEKRTLTPRPETLAVDGDQVRIERPGLQRTMSLQQLPEVAPLIESLRATLNGDRQALDRVFVTRLDGSRDAWQLTLQPRASGSGGVAQRIVLRGSRAAVQQIDIEQRDGDRSVMRILESR